MLLAHKIQLYPDEAQTEYLRRCIGARRFAFNALLAHFKQDGVKWSKKAAYEFYLKQVRQPWMAELTSRAPRIKKKGINDSFALREKTKFDVDGRSLRLEKAPGRIRMRQLLRFAGEPRSVTVSLRAGKFYAAILVETEDYITPCGNDTVGVDFGLKALATLSTGEVIPANQKLKSGLRRLKRRSRNLSRKQRGSNKRAKAKLSLSKLHQRIANQRRAVLHELSDDLTRRFEIITIEDLNVKGMLKNRSLARSIADAGFGMLRSMLEYKAELRGNTIILANRFYPSSKTCFECKEINPAVVLGVQEWACPSCGTIHERDYNAARNLNEYGQHTFRADLYKRTQERGQTSEQSGALVLTE